VGGDTGGDLRGGGGGGGGYVILALVASANIEGFRLYVLPETNENLQISLRLFILQSATPVKISAPRPRGHEKSVCT